VNVHRVRVVGLLVAVAALITLATPGLARADMVTQWNLYANNALAHTATQTPPGAGQTPPVSALHFAMVQGAVYNAVNAIDGGHQPYLGFEFSAATRSDSKEAAAATAAYRVLVSLVPAQQDAGWTPLIPTPPYPDHPSGHLGVSSSFAITLKQFYGTNDLAWTDTNTLGMTRSYSGILQALDEIVSLRVWSGLHFRTADEQSAPIGKEIAHWRLNHFFQPVAD
jgi:hypothetical protein